MSHSRFLYRCSRLMELQVENVGFQEGRKPGNPEKNPQSKARTNNKLNPHVTLGWNQTQAALVGASILSLRQPCYPAMFVHCG